MKKLPNILYRFAQIYLLLLLVTFVFHPPHSWYFSADRSFLVSLILQAYSLIRGTSGFFGVISVITLIAGSLRGRKTEDSQPVEEIEKRQKIFRIFWGASKVSGIVLLLATFGIPMVDCLINNGRCSQGIEFYLLPFYVVCLPIFLISLVVSSHYKQ